eukprot:jgi/Psemu1/210187/e_gw1.525.21.1
MRGHIIDTPVHSLLSFPLGNAQVTEQHVVATQQHVGDNNNNNNNNNEREEDEDDDDIGDNNNNNNRKTSSSSDSDSDVLPDPPSHFSIDYSLSKELLKLSFKDRQAIEEEIHGVRCRAPTETPELLERSLEEFDRYLDTPNNNNIHNNIHNRCYLNDPAVRLKFLRFECFNAFNAVTRLVRYLELTSELFGDYVADRPIRISDFSTRREIATLHHSRNQYLPFRDRSGRRVFVGVGSLDLDMDSDLKYKVTTFLHWIASEDVETQQRGVVVVVWPSNENDSDSDREPTELRYVLASYGIPQQLLPLSNTGTVKTSIHSRWINALKAKLEREQRQQKQQQRRQQQQQHGYNYGLNHHHHQSDTTTTTTDDDDDDDALPEEIVDCPRSKDVIFRKGPACKNNPGNMYFRELIQATHAEHTRGSRKVKCRITWQIMGQIEAQNGRFLDWCPSRELWVVARDREKIRTKVAACCKQYNRSVLALQEQQQK